MSGQPRDMSTTDLSEGRLVPLTQRKAGSLCVFLTSSITTQVVGTPLCLASQVGELGHHAGIEIIDCPADSNWSEIALDFVLECGSDETPLALQTKFAQRSGPLIGIWRLASVNESVPLERLVLERSVSHNTAASGGNVDLMRLAPSKVV